MAISLRRRNIIASFGFAPKRLHLRTPSPHRYVQSAKQMLSNVMRSREVKAQDDDDDETSTDSGLSTVPDSLVVRSRLLLGDCTDVRLRVT